MKHILVLGLLFNLLFQNLVFAEDWPKFGFDFSNQRFSPLAQIDRSNVSSLELAWTFSTGFKASFQTTPIKVGHRLFISTPFNHVIALNAETGEQLWRYEHPKPNTKSCCGPANRGVAVAQGKVLQATVDGQLLALDEKTGKVVWQTQIEDTGLSIQESIDGLLLDADLDNVQVTGGTSHSFNMAPQIYKNTVLIGSTGAGYGLHLDTEKGLKVVGIGDGRTGLRGFLAAFDLTSGKELWRWYSVNGEHWVGDWKTHTTEGVSFNRDIQQEQAKVERFQDSWKLGGGSIWTTPAIDPETGWLFIGTGNPAPNMDSSTRPGDNRHTSSIVALDSKTGQMQWAFQQVPHDRWGYDVSSPPVLFDAVIDGKAVKALGQAGKTGWFYVLDRTTGELLFKSDPFVPQQNLFADPTEDGVKVAPGIAGGSNWSPVAVNPHKKQVYIAGIHMPAIYYRKPLQAGSSLPWQTYSYFEFAKADRYGTLTAINLQTGKTLWQNQTRLPMLGGALVTAGGLVFSGEGDGEFFAVDEDTGEKLWSHKQQYGVNAPAISYSVNGRQYIAVAAGGNKVAGFPTGDSLLVYRLSSDR